MCEAHALEYIGHSLLSRAHGENVAALPPAEPENRTIESTDLGANFAWKTRT